MRLDASVANGGTIAPSRSNCGTVESVQHFGGSPELAALSLAALDHYARVGERSQGSVAVLASPPEFGREQSGIDDGMTEQ